MTVTETHEGRGQFNIRLSESTPPEIRDLLDEFGHVAVTGTRLDPRRQGDGILDDAWAGVVLEVSDDDAPGLSGQGLAWHLGDHEGKGRVYTTEPLTASSYTFADAIRGLLPASVAEGTLHAVAGTYTPGTHLWQTPRQAIDRVCGLFEAEWRVRPHSTDGVRLDAGEPSQLWPDVTTIVAKGVNGREPSGLEGLPAVRMARHTDGRDYTTKVVALPEGEGDTLVTDAATATLDPADIPYTDLRGNTLEVTRIVSLSDVSRGNAQAAADVQLNRFNSAKDAHELDVDRYHISGVVEPGVTVAIYDPVKGLVDPGNPTRFAGRTIWPVSTRVRAVTWPVEDGMGVYYRGSDGGWHDLTDYVQFESGSSQVDIGRARSLTAGGEPVGVRLQTEDDGRTPATPAFVTPFATGVYLDAEGKTRAHVTVAWDTPILNDDGSTVTDGAHVEVVFRESGATSWDVRNAGWGEGNVRLTGLDPGVNYDFRARAVDVHGNRSAWTAVHTQTAEVDTIPPSTPAAPTVAGSVLYIQVTHDLGQASGGTFNLESDLDHLEVHVGTTSTFTPDATTLEGTLTANAGMLAQSVSAVGTFEVPDTTTRWVKVIAVDHAGNKSDPSAAASVTAALVDTQHITDAIITTAKISDLAVTNAKIADLSVSTAKIVDAAVTNAKIDTLDAGKITTGFLDSDRIEAGSIEASHLVVGRFENLLDNPGFETGDLTAWSVLAASGATISVTTTAALLGTFGLDITDIGAATAAITVRSATHPAAQDETFGLEAWAEHRGTNAQTVRIQLVFRDSGGVLLTNHTASMTTSNRHEPLEVQGTAPANTATVEVKLEVTSFGTVGAVSWDEISIHRAASESFIENLAISTAKIKDAAIDTAKIADLAVTSAKIDSLVADKIVAGTISGETITVGSAGQIVFDNDTAMNLGGRWYVRKNATTLDFEIVDFIAGVTRLQILDGGKGQLLRDTGANVLEWGVGETSGSVGNAVRIPNELYVNIIESDGDLSAGNGVFLVVTGDNFPVQQDGRQRPVQDDVWQIGTSSFRYTSVWATDGTINTSDVNTKKDVTDLDPAAALAFVRSLRTVSHRWPDGVRPHHAFLAADVIARARDVGWDDHAAYVDPSVAALIPEDEDAPLGLRSHELIPDLAAAIQELADRLDALEGAN